MMKQGYRKSIKSIIESHIDPEENEKISRAKREITAMSQNILEFLKIAGANIGNHAIMNVLEDYQNHYESLYERYYNLTKVLKEFCGSSSSSSSDSDDYANKNVEQKLEITNFGSARSVVKEVEKLIVSKNEEINQLEETVDHLKTVLEMKEDEIYVLMEKMRAKEEEVEALTEELTSDIEGEAKLASEVSTKMDETLEGIDTLRFKFEGHFGHLRSQIIEISNELKYAMKWISEKDEIEEDKGLVLPIEEEKIGEMEKVMRERDELDRKMREKDSEMLRLNEEKTKVVEQLCAWIDYYHSHNENLKHMIWKTRGGI